MSSENLDLGLAAVRAVHLGAERRDLDEGVVLAAPDRAEALTLEPHRIGPPAARWLHRVGPRVRGDVDVGALAIEEGVAHAAADEVALVPGVGEQPRQLLRRRLRVEQRLETGRDRGHSHHCRLLGDQTCETSARIPTGPGPLRYVRSVEPAPACSRLGCDQSAVAMFAFDARESLVWLDPIERRSRRRRPLPAPCRPDVAAPGLEPARPPSLRVPPVDRTRRRRVTHLPRAASGTRDPLANLRHPRAVAAVRRDAGARGRVGHVRRAGRAGITT